MRGKTISEILPQSAARIAELREERTNGTPEPIVVEPTNDVDVSPVEPTTEAEETDVS
jgi:hypothetical protein